MYPGNLQAGSVASLEVVVNEADQLRSRERADLGGFDVAVLEQHQRRDATDAITGWRSLIVVDIQLDDLQAAGIVKCDVCLLYTSPSPRD